MQLITVHNDSNFSQLTFDFDLPLFIFFDFGSHFGELSIFWLLLFLDILQLDFEASVLHS